MPSLKNAGQKQIKLKKLLTISFLFLVFYSNAQTDEQKLTTTMKEFHQALVNKNTVSINQQTDKALSYGHSNGWIETKTEMMKNLETGFISYQSFKEDSISVLINGTMANVRFVTDITATMKGSTNTYHLKVLEVWVKKSKRWVLFGRQAVRD
jgi:CRISPR/Cas system CSM-associated protein Csm4 (group 5 of RAMP superfamily)